MAGDPEKALREFQAGKPLAIVAASAGYRGPADAQRAVKRLLEKRGTVTDPDLVRMAAMDRMDQMLQAVWPAVKRGELGAIATAQGIEEKRLRLLALASTSESGAIVTAVERSVAALTLHPSDEAAVAAARRVALQMDQAATVLDPTVQTKAAYLVPHLVNVLRELGATPAARQIVKNTQGGEGGKSAKLTALRGGRAAAGA